MPRGTHPWSLAGFLGDPGHPRHALYDISPNDQRFVMFRRVQAEQGELIWVVNFFEELKAKVGNE